MRRGRKTALELVGMTAACPQQSRSRANTTFSCPGGAPQAGAASAVCVDNLLMRSSSDTCSTVWDCEYPASTDKFVPLQLRLRQITEEGAGVGDVPEAAPVPPLTPCGAHRTSNPPSRDSLASALARPPVGPRVAMSEISRPGGLPRATAPLGPSQLARVHTALSANLRRHETAPAATDLSWDHLHLSAHGLSSPHSSRSICASEGLSLEQLPGSHGAARRNTLCLLVPSPSADSPASALLHNTPGAADVPSTELWNPSAEAMWSRGSLSGPPSRLRAASTASPASSVPLWFQRRSSDVLFPPSPTTVNAGIAERLRAVPAADEGRLKLGSRFTKPFYGQR